MKPRLLPAAVLCLCSLAQDACSQGTKQAMERIAREWKNGQPSDERHFLIGVWLQDPKNAARYKTAGINLYVGLWRGSSTNQLATLQRAGMAVICAQNRTGLENKDHPSIVGWMHDDEPNNP